MDLNIPFPILLVLAGVIYWPVTVTLLVLACAGVALTRGWVRVVLGIVAALLAADCLLAAWLAFIHR